MQGRYKSKVREVLAELCRGLSASDAATAHGMHPTYGVKVARRAGLFKRYITNAEWRAIRSQRKNTHGMA